MQQPQYPYQQQQPQSPYQQPQYSHQTQLKYVGFWGRVPAFLIDMVLLTAVGYGLALIHAPQPLISLVGIAYLIGMEAIWGATIGKLLFGLRVRKLDGSRISWKEAVTRNLILAVEELTLFIVTIITINNSPIRQRWGDRVAGTVVIKI